MRHALRTELAGESLRGERGSVLLASLFFGAALGLVLGSYMVVVQSQHISSVRSQSWQTALTLAEAGAEEALAQLNSAPAIGAGQLAMNHWGSEQPGVFGPVSRTLKNGSYAVVLASAGSAPPIIYSTGYVTVPSISAKLARRVQLTTTNLPLFNAAIAVRSNISVTGNTRNFVLADSFDFLHPGAGKNDGDILSLAGPVNIGLSKVIGDLMVGSTVNATNLAAQVSGQVAQDLNVDFQDVVAPAKNWLPAAVANAKKNGIIYTYILGGMTDYEVLRPGSIYVQPGSQIKLKIAAPVFEASAIYVAGTGSQKSTLTIYEMGQSFTLSGNATVESGDPSSLTYFGSPANTSILFKNRANFTGTLYAPSANFVGSVSALQPASFTGACVLNSLTLNGLYSFHFDENLLRSPTLSRGYVVTSWKEL
jgi:hypothetical protein